MRKLFILSLLSIIFLRLEAQTPLTEAVDFTAKDIHGYQHHLFDVLDNQNKYVLIDFFSVTCGPCQELAPKVNEVYSYFGSNDLELYVLAIDQFFDNEMVEGFENEFNTNYPAISGVEGGGSQIFESFEIPYYPSLILIAPDHSIVEQAIPIPETTQELIDLLEGTYGLQTVSVNELESETAFNIYPNPATHYFVLEAPENQIIESLSIFSITGKEVYRQESFSNTQQIRVNIEDLRKGMYLVSAEYADGSRFSNRFVKE